MPRPFEVKKKDIKNYTAFIIRKINEVKIVLVVISYIVYLYT